MRIFLFTVQVLETPFADALRLSRVEGVHTRASLAVAMAGFVKGWTFENETIFVRTEQGYLHVANYWHAS